MTSPQNTHGQWMGSGMTVQRFKDEAEVLIYYTRKYLSESADNLRRFSQTMAQELAESGYIDACAADEFVSFEKFRSAKQQQLTRILNGVTAMPLSWKLVWLDLLPQPYSDRARRDVSLLSNVLTIPLPSDDGAYHGASSLPFILREMADVVSASAPASDGVIDHQDCTESLLKYRNELADVAQVVLAEVAKVNCVLASRDGGDA
ncbi:hypothetical protein ABMA58_00045 [Oceanospirillum sp. HFRX-1_2]